VAARAPQPDGARRDLSPPKALLGALRLLPVRALVQPGDLLGRKADGLFVLERADPEHRVAAAGAVVRGLAATLQLLRLLLRWAALGKTLHLDPALTFNLGIALVAGLTAAAASRLGRW